MANQENLIPLGKGYRTESEERKMRQTGGINSGVSRRNKKTMREACELVMALPTSAQNCEKLKAIGIKKEDATNQVAVVVALLQKAMKGDLKVLERLGGLQQNHW